MSFFGNSGVKIGNHDSAVEVQIFDTKSLDEAFSLSSSSFTNGILQGQLQTFPNSNEVRQFDSDDGRDVMDNYLTGTPYNNSSFTLLDFSDFREALSRLNTEEENHLEITLVPDGLNGNHHFTVKLNNQAVFANLWQNKTISVQTLRDNPYVYLQSHWGSGVIFSNLNVSSIQQNE